MAKQKDTVSRRGFIGTIGAAVAATALPAPTAGKQPMAEAEPLDAAGRWYDALLERITRAWEPHFRFGRFRPDEGNDYEDRAVEPPRYELENALAAAVALDERRAALVISVSPSLGESDDSGGVIGYAELAMTSDVLARAERLGYFADPCPEALRFPDLPTPKDDRDDLERAESELQSARTMVSLSQAHDALVAAGFGGEQLRVSSSSRRGLYGPGLSEDEERERHKERLANAEKRLADMKAGKVVCRTAKEKREAHALRRRKIIAAYAARLGAAGVDASWVDLTDAGWAAVVARRG